MKITVNGETKEVTQGLSLAELVEKIGLDAGRVAVEVNRRIVRRQAWQETALKPDDSIEIVTFVGGG